MIQTLAPPPLTHPHQVDFFILVISVLILALQALLSDASVAQGLRVLRAIKPLRMLTRSAGMRMVFKSIVLSLAGRETTDACALLFASPSSQDGDGRSERGLHGSPCDPSCKHAWVSKGC